MSHPPLCPNRILLRVLLCVTLLSAPLATDTPDAQAALPAEETEVSGEDAAGADAHPRQATSGVIFYV